jgi:glycosyltransferase involved in cell wall biosynthesis
MKLLVVSHACVTAVNQSFYAEVERITGWNVSIVVPAFWNSEYQSHIEAARWKDFRGMIHPLPVWKSGNIPLHVYKSTMLGLLRTEQPDIIYVNHEPYGLATAQVYLANRLANNVPIGVYGSQNILKRYPIPFRWFERLVLKRSKFCFTLNAAALKVLRQKGYTGIAEVLPMPVDQSVYYPRPEWAAAKRAELCIGPDEFVIGYMGRLIEEKGLRTMLLAAQLLHGRIWRCILVGSGPYESNLRATVVELGLEQHVIFVGFVPHVEAPGWLSLFDVLILASESRPNWEEQFGRVLIEAAACETAVIGTESGEIGNVLRSTGGGLIVPEADPTQLGRAILELADNPNRTRELALQGAASVREKYDASYLAERFANLISRAYEMRG